MIMRITKGKLDTWASAAIESEDMDKLKKIAKRENSSVSAVVRQAIKVHIQADDAKRDGARQ